MLFNAPKPALLLLWLLKIIAENSMCLWLKVDYSIEKQIVNPF